MADPVERPATGQRAARPGAGHRDGRMPAQPEPAALAAELRSLRLACGNPSYAALRRGSALLPPATISDALRGRVMPRLDFVIAFVQGCARNATDRGLDVDPALTDLQNWRRRWLRAERQVQVGRRGAGAPPAEDVPDQETSAHPDTRSGIAIGGTPVASSPPWQLPTAVRRLFGRDDALAWLDGIASGSSVTDRRSDGSRDPGDGAGDPSPDRESAGVPGESAPVALLTGMGGVGKTALAVSWGHRRRAEFPDGQLFADLGGYGPGNPAEPAPILTLFVRALGALSPAIPGDVDGLAALFRSLCTGRKILVVLDNAFSVEQVLPLLPASPGAMAIVTSRDGMNGLAVRADARRLVLRPLPDDDAVALLTRDLPAESPERLRRLAAICGNLPLALRLAASRLSDDPRDADLIALADGGDPGAAGGLLSVLADPSDPYGDLATVLSWSLAGGSAAESRAILLLAQSSSGPMDDRLAAALIGLPVLPARQLLSTLAGRHLVERRQDRWSLHDIIRAWARDTGQRELGARQCREAQRRMLGYYLWTADAMDRALLPQRGRPPLASSLPTPLSAPRWSDVAGALAWGDAVLSAIPDAIGVALEIGEFECAALLPHILMSYLNLRKPWAQWIALCQAGIAGQDRIESPELLANLHIAAGIALRETQAVPAAVEEFSAALAAYRSAGSAVGVAMTMNNLATSYQQLGRSDKAREVLLQADRELAGSDDAYRRAIVLHNLAEAEIDLNELPDALAHAGQAMVAAIAAGDDIGAAATRTTVGRIHVLLGNLDIAEAEFTASLAVQRSGADRLGEATTARQLGRLLLEEGRAAEAVTQLSDAVEILGGLGDPAVAEAGELLALADGGAAVPTARRRRRRVRPQD